MKPLLIFPCKADKTPNTPNGLYDAAPENTWTVDAPYFGAPTGAANGFVVVDFDVKGGGLETFDSLEDMGDAPQIVITPSGGRHVYYKYTPDMADLKNRVRFLPGVDFRTNGGYVCLYDNLQETQAEMPEWLKAKLREKSTVLADIAKGDRSVAEGGRNDYLSRVAGRMQKLGVLTMAALMEQNERDCEPALDEAEVQLIFDSISRYAPDSTPDEDPIPEKPIVWANEMLSDFLAYIRDKGKMQGDPTGIDELDELLGGGKRLGELTVTMAEAKSGKNTLWHFLQRKQLDAGTPIAYASRELSPETEVLPNLLTLKLGKNIYTTTDLSEEEVLNALKDWKLAFAPGYGSFLSTDVLFAWMDACRVHDIRYFYIDHLHYCLPDSEDFKSLSEFGRKLKSYAKKHTVHIDLIIQPKGLDPLVRVDLDIHHLRGGASLGQVLDTLITMQRERDDHGNLINVTKVQTKRARFKLAKNGCFYLAYDKDLMSFRAFKTLEAALNEANSAPIEQTFIESTQPYIPPKVVIRSNPFPSPGRTVENKTAGQFRKTFDDGSPIFETKEEPRPVVQDGAALAGGLIKRMRNSAPGSDRNG